MYFPTKYLRTYPQNHPKPHFGGPFNAKAIIQRALRQSHVNGATTLKFYGYIGTGKYLGCVKNFPLGDVWGGGAEPLNENLGPPIISETTGARKLKLKTPLHMVKYPHRVQKLLYYTTQHEDGRHIDFRQMSISEADYS